MPTAAARGTLTTGLERTLTDRLRSKSAYRTRRVALALTVALHLAACPQLAKDSFDKVKVDADNSVSSNGGGQNSSTTTLGTTGVLIVGGVGGVGGAGDGSGTVNGDPSSTSVGGTSAGAAGEGGSTSSTTGAGGTSVAPTTLIYARSDNSLLARAWTATGLGAATQWTTSDSPIGFVEAQMAPDRSWSLAAFQAEGDEACSLSLFRHAGSDGVPLETIPAMGEPGNCLRARGFDIAFEEQSGRALLVYALPGAELGYYVLERGKIVQRHVLPSSTPERAINWVRAVPDSASNRIAVGFTAEGDTQNSLIVQEWDGEEFGEPHTLVPRGSILDSESFDFAYYEGQLIALRGDVSKDGIGYHLRHQDGRWAPEEFRPAALNGNAQGIELRNLPTGVAGALFDATGTVASFGTLLWQDGDFAEETQLDITLPDVSNFESSSLKTDIQRLGGAAVTVYVDDYDGEPDARSSLGWAVLQPDSEWTSQQETLPVPFDQESRGALTRSIRMARFTAEQEGLLLAFGEDDGLFVSSLTDLELGFTPPSLVDQDVDGSVSTPFALAGP